MHEEWGPLAKLIGTWEGDKGLDISIHHDEYVFLDNFKHAGHDVALTLSLLSNDSSSSRARKLSRAICAIIIKNIKIIASTI